MSVQLPEELIIEILLRVSLKDLPRLKRVCTRWRDLIHSHSFIDMYEKFSREKFVYFSGADLYLVDFQESKLEKLNFPLESMLDRSTIALHCRGLLCITLKNDYLVVWNPFSNKFKITPRLEVYRDFQILGFGYDPFCDDHKIVAIVQRLDTCRAYIFELKSNSWKESLQILPPNWFYTDRKGTVVDQNVYWIAHRWIYDPFILCFNFTTQTHQELCYPTRTDDLRKSWLGVMGRKLCVIEYIPMNKVIKIWTMEKTDANVETWNNFITISTSNVVPRSEWSDYHIDSLRLTKNNDLLVTFIKDNEFMGFEYTKKKVFLCMTKDKTFKEVRCRDSLVGFRVLDGYAESLASINLP